MRWLLLLSVGCAPVGDEVLDSGHGSARTLEPGCAGSPYTSIQQALDDARDGDVIEVCAGTYPERLTVEGKALTLRSREGAEKTVVDAQQLGVALSVSGGAALTVDGLTLRGGTDPGNGGNLYCSFSTLWLEGSRLEGGSAVTGGGLGATSCDGHVVGNTFEGNEAWSGGAAWVYGDELAFEENVFVSNHADGAGGAIYLYGSSPVTGNLFEGNDAALSAGALYVDQGAGEVRGNTFRDNLSGGDGGALYLFAGTPQVLTNRFVSNRAGARGGALAALDSEIEVANSLLRGNVADEGGALSLQGVTGTLRQLVMLRNEAATGSALAADGDVELFNSVLGWNRGGAVLSGEVGAHHNDSFRNEGEELAGNLSVPPGFASLTQGDYTLDATSPLRNAGDPDVLDADGTRSDIGLYGGEAL
jgi:hypothetical protein